ncbi:MAG: hypothetical protein GX458_10000 [Phyllobacteriaceae bacterium]|nr:hypothetical protein [Phyllobacteriaceae bacterium]
MSSNLAPHLPDGSGTGGGVRVWLKSSGYARRLLAGAEGDPWETPAAYLSFFAQAHGLLRPDVAVIDVADLYRSWTRRHPDLVADMGARRRVAVPLRKLLDEDGPRRVLDEVVEAVLAHMRGRSPVVLAFPGPRAWLEEAKAIAGLADLEVDDDAVEDAAMYLADLLRAVSSHPIAGVLFEEDGAREIDAAALAAYRPILNVAEHYRWGVALRGRFADGLDPAALAEFDAVIAERPFEAPLAGAFGLDVGAAVWRGEPAPECAGKSFRFVEIPVEARPETVLDSLDRLR